MMLSNRFPALCASTLFALAWTAQALKTHQLKGYPKSARPYGLSKHDWLPDGCYTTSTDAPALNGASKTTSDMDIATCLDFCTLQSLYWAGIRGNTCSCGPSLDNGHDAEGGPGHGSVYGIDSSGCTTQCPGNSAQRCGGPDRMTTFHSEVRPKAKIYTSTTDGSTYVYKGCYNETVVGPLFDDLYSNFGGDSAYGPQFCRNSDTIEQRTFGFANRNKLYCSNSNSTVPTNSAFEAAKLPDTSCEQSCLPWKSGQLCGGQGAISIWNIDTHCYFPETSACGNTDD